MKWSKLKTATLSLLIGPKLKLLLVEEGHFDCLNEYKTRNFNLSFASTRYDTSDTLHYILLQWYLARWRQICENGDVSLEPWSEIGQGSYRGLREHALCKNKCAVTATGTWWGLNLDILKCSIISSQLTCHARHESASHMYNYKLYVGSHHYRSQIGKRIPCCHCQRDNFDILEFRTPKYTERMWYVFLRSRSQSRKMHGNGSRYRYSTTLVFRHNQCILFGRDSKALPRHICPRQEEPLSGERKDHVGSVTSIKTKMGLGLCSPMKSSQSVGVSNSTTLAFSAAHAAWAIRKSLTRSYNSTL